ncbi:hypothetical protein B0H17DRAFT_1147501 [Mycena rosella]|uniref:Protein kinase domain-containing protein n=1 Tax=Mycena rosella TaxID=1033263 RepID=A0AAD7CNZ6_MYCRO|nr:hypothetical protein B0H17DRAFT_1147501 [Mycena rosella]
MSFISNVDHLTLGEGVYNNIHGNLNIIHNTFYGQKRHREEIGDVPDLLAFMGSMRKCRRRREDSEDGIDIIQKKDLKVTLQIASGPGYCLHAGEAKGRAVIVKVFNPSATVREQQLELTVALSKEIMHPNVLRVEGVSSPESMPHFIIYGNAHWKTAEGPLADALKDDLIRSITLGFKMIARLSSISLESGMHQLSVQGISLASLGAENFDIFLDINDRFLISINPPMSTETDAAYDQRTEDNTVRSWDVFNALCQKVLRSANRLLHNEDIERHPALPDVPRRSFVPQESLAMPSLNLPETIESPASRSLSEAAPTIPPRREYVWRTIDHGEQSLATVSARISFDLDTKLSSSVTKLVQTHRRNPHRCPGYVREEITLASTTGASAGVPHDAPSPLEICSICHEVVGFYEKFRSGLAVHGEVPDMQAVESHFSFGMANTSFDNNRHSAVDFDDTFSGFSFSRYDAGSAPYQITIPGESSAYFADVSSAGDPQSLLVRGLPAQHMQENDSVADISTDVETVPDSEFNEISAILSNTGVPSIFALGNFDPRSLMDHPTGQLEVSLGPMHFPAFDDPIPSLSNFPCYVLQPYAANITDFPNDFLSFDSV